MSKRKRQTGPDVHTRIRQTPAERILAQRAQRSEVIRVNAGNQEEDHRCDQQLGPGPVQQPRTPRVDGDQHGHDQQLHPAPTRQADTDNNHQAQPCRRAQEASRSIETDGGRDLAGRHHAGPCTVPAKRSETVVDGKGTGHVEGDNEDGLDAEEEQDHARRRKVQKEHEKLRSLPPLRPSLTVQTNVPQTPVLQSQPVPAAKRRVGLAFSYCDCVLKLL